MIMIPWPAGNDPSTMVASAMAPVMSDELGVPARQRICRGRHSGDPYRLS
jgi:hypothetical protein